MAFVRFSRFLAFFEHFAVGGFDPDFVGGEVPAICRIAVAELRGDCTLLATCVDGESWDSSFATPAFEVEGETVPGEGAFDGLEFVKAFETSVGFDDGVEEFFTIW